MSPPSPATQDPRIYFAAERTFLAWIRTGLGLMGVGFAVSRFALFLRELGAGQLHPGGGEPHVAVHTTGLSLYAGILLVVLGVAVMIGAVSYHVRIIHELRDGTWRPGRVSRLAITVALLLAVLGVGIAAYLLLLR